MKRVIKSVGVIVFALVMNLNFSELISNVDSDTNSFFVNSLEETLGLEKIDQYFPDSFYLENSLLNCFSKQINTDIALFKCKSNDFKRANDSVFVEEIVYEGEDAENDYILFVVETYYFCDSNKVSRAFSTEVYHQNSEVPYYSSSIALEQGNLGLDYSLKIPTALSTKETLNFVRNFFNKDFKNRVAACRKLPVIE